MKKFSTWVIAIVVLLAFIVIGGVDLFTDWLWFSEVGYQSLFIKPIMSELVIGLIAGVIVFLVLSLIYNTARKYSPSSHSYNIKINTPQGPRVKLVDAGNVVKRITLPITIILSIITAIISASHWETVLLFLNKSEFGTADPLFGKDVSYYFFTLPFIQLILQLVFAVIIMGIIGSIIVYSVLGVIQLKDGLKNVIRTSGSGIIRSAMRHISILFAMLFVAIAFKIYYIDIPSLVYSGKGSFIGASYTDVHITLPVLQILSLMAVFMAFVFIFHAFKRRFKLLATTFTIYMIIGIVGGWILPELVQQFIVLPNELVKETKYIQNNISATQKSYGIDTVEERDLSGETTLTKQDITNNIQTINNIRLWDRDPLLDTFSQLQEIRTYYEFLSVDNDRYTVEGKLRQVLLSVREINSESLPQRNFINEHLTFTHGYGLTLSPVNEVTNEGLPVLFVKDLPPASSQNEFNIKRPEIYYGEMSNDYAVVNTAAKEFNYPSGEDNVYANYEGNGGIHISLVNRILFAIKFKSSKLLLSNDISADSRLMMYRDIDSRVGKLAPFLKFDLDPYLIITDSGELEWIYDAYTTSSQYPYAERVSNSRLRDLSIDTAFASSDLNYIRNSVKITINAYSGAMNMYVSDLNDPIIQSYQKVFPNVFKSMNDMPKDILSHVRYPEDLFAFQTNVYAVYHMDEPQNFYNKEDEWQIPSQPQHEDSDPMMRHMIMKLPGEEKEEYILMLPFTPKGKDNLAAWMVARNDAENYGKILVYRFPKQKLVYGPNQIINRIQQDPEISRQISLWDQRGSEVISGNLLVIPIEESLIYVQPIYLRAEGGKIPELKRVIVAYESSIAMEENLTSALDKIFNTGDDNTTNSDEDVDGDSVTNDSTLIEQASTIYNQAIEAQKSGDWTTYGNKINELGEIINQLLQE